MSRIGLASITIESGVTITINDREVIVTGPKGSLTVAFPYGLAVTQENGVLSVSKVGNARTLDAMHGTIRALLANAVKGVTKGWTKTLELQGVGYRAAVTGVNLVLTVGFSHPVTLVPPQGITYTIVDGKIVVSGIDKHLVGQTAATVRAVKPPEPYKGKGIRYVGEYVRRKAGKSAKAVGGAK